MNNIEVAKGLREMADYLEAHPEIKVYPSLAPSVPQFCDTKGQLADVARAHAPLAKRPVGDWFKLRKEFPGGVAIEWALERNKVCRQVVTGQRTVTRPVMQQVGEETVQEDVTEWQCDEPLLSATAV